VNYKFRFVTAKSQPNRVKTDIFFSPPPKPIHIFFMVALVQRPAPGFTAPTVVDGVFEDVSLSDFLGKWFAPLPLSSRR
jgi:hypothetical protein